MKIFDNIKNVLVNTAISSGNIMVISGILVYLISGNLLGLIYSIALIVGSILNLFIKEGLKLLFPNSLFLKRPSISKRGCGIVRQCLSVKELNLLRKNMPQGMPSGHSQMAVFSSFFWILFLWKNMRYTKDYPNYLLWTSTIILSLLGISIMISRSFLVENCHTIPQIIVGGIIGGFYAWFIYGLIEHYYPTLLEKKDIKSNESKNKSISNV